jgi:hypothetical protein
MSLILSGASFRQSFCPTIGEGGHWLGVGGPRRGSQDSAAYGFDLHPETRPKNEVKNDRMVGEYFQIIWL